MAVRKTSNTDSMRTGGQFVLVPSYYGKFNFTQMFKL